MNTLKNIMSAVVVGGLVGFVHFGWGAILAIAIVLGEARKIRDRIRG